MSAKTRLRKWQKLLVITEKPSKLKNATRLETLQTRKYLYLLIFRWPVLLFPTLPPLHLSRWTEIQHAFLVSSSLTRLRRLRHATAKDATVLRLRFHSCIHENILCDWFLSSPTLSLTRTHFHEVTPSASLAPFPSYWDTSWRKNFIGRIVSICETFFRSPRSSWSNEICEGFAGICLHGCFPYRKKR